ncbi:hypothetical protein GQ43DRAFT_413590 [Delitschia confertaspora ATCC 74209]|uniref:Pentatricopeptide repeat domain protein n=1 Tax=Delitschia confertaspora ATCC 74209 TaxID=1513339 RepID=A0A9P4MWS6_9PLEO|nr:hypothetical protein GQ43DRAFT_413590 [Delitschia confertaspora ATCC 74209]
MSNPYICTTCRIRLIQRVAYRPNPQWQPKASFISLRGLRKSPVDNKQASSEVESPATDKPSDSTLIPLQRPPSIPLNAPGEHPPSGPASNGAGADGSFGIREGQDVFSDLLIPQGPLSSSGQSLGNTKPAMTKEELHIALEDAEWLFGQRGSGTGRYSRFVHRETSNKPVQTKQPDAMLETAPTRASEPCQPPTPSEPLVKKVPAEADFKKVSPVSGIQNHLDAGNVHPAWELLRTYFIDGKSPALVHPSLTDLPLLKKGIVFRRLLKAVIEDYFINQTAWLSPSKVLLRYEQAKLARTDIWIDGIETFTYKLLSTLATEKPDIERTEILVSELMAVWRLFFQCKGPKNIPLAAVDGEWASLARFRTPDERNRGNHLLNFQNMLQTYHPKFPWSNKIALSALFMFAVFSHQKPNFQISESLRSENEPFIKLIAQILHPGGRESHLGSVIQEMESSVQFASLPEDFREELVKQVKSAPTTAMVMIGAEKYTDPRILNVERPVALQDFYKKRITRAAESADERRLESLWQEVLKAYGPSKEGENTNIPRPVYCAFLTAFLGTRKADRAIDTWNHMIANGVVPDVYAWTAMLTGCQKARDVDGLNEMWARMNRSGVQPDVYAWTARISGLIERRRLKDGLAALEEMGRAWLQGEAAINAPNAQGMKRPTTQPTRKVNPYPKPTIETINAAIHEITDLPVPNGVTSRTARHRAIDKILRWAGRFSIKPDVITYNTLIRLRMREHDGLATFKLLQQMEEEGIEPDVATFTMLIRAFFDNNKLDELPQDEQIPKIIALLEELENRGLKLNAYTYSQTIDRLIHQYNNMPAVRTVLDHMLARGLKPSPMIYTSLMMHYFNQTPPDIPSVDSLWLRITSTPGMVIDKILFDRVIEGYANAGEIGKTMSVLVRMGKHGKQPGWVALTAVVRALVEAGDSARAQGIVEDVVRTEGVAKYGVTGAEYGRREFWGMVRELGLEVQGEDDLGVRVGEEEIVAES